jgi:hypothetical protein
MDWLKASWAYIVFGAVCVGAVIKSVRAAYAAERDRAALKNSELEREKLTLEVARLRNSPEVVADRRVIYDRLRLLISEITRDADATIVHIRNLHEVAHDSEFRFPPEVVERIRTLIESAIELHVSNLRYQRGLRALSAEDLGRLGDENANALKDIVDFEGGLVPLFRPHLSL